jgi:hypothetical protein
LISTLAARSSDEFRSLILQYLAEVILLIRGRIIFFLFDLPPDRSIDRSIDDLVPPGSPSPILDQSPPEEWRE